MTDETERPRFYAVDRIEGARTRRTAILMDDDGTECHVPLGDLPTGVEEGAVLRVMLRQGQPQWPSAALDETERARRTRELAARMGRLRRDDPGGDLVL